MFEAATLFEAGFFLWKSNKLFLANGEFDINQVDDDGWEDWHRKIGADATSADLEGLETGKSYCFRIATKNAAGKSKWTTFGPVICAEEVIDPAITVPRKMTRLIQVSQFIDYKL